VIERIDGKCLAGFSARDEIVEIAIGVGGPNLLDKHDRDSCQRDVKEIIALNLVPSRQSEFVSPAISPAALPNNAVTSYNWIAINE
jgi:hypothetical protein